MGKLFPGGPLLEKGASPSSETTFFKKKATPSYCVSVACLQRRLFSQIHESWEQAMASTACPFRTGGKKDVFSTLASLFAFSRASFSNSVMYEDSLHKASEISLTRIKNEFKRTKKKLLNSSKRAWL